MRAVLFLLALSNTVAVCAERLDPESVVAEVSRDGASKTVAHLIGGENWNYVMEKIATGDPQWLKTAAALRAGVDAGSSDDLQDAESNALAREPYAYLRHSESAYGWTPYETCSFAWDSDVPGGMKKYLKRVEKSLKRSASQESSRLKDGCLRGLYESRQVFQVEAAADRECIAACKSHGQRAAFRGIESDPWCECYETNMAPYYPARNAPNNSLQARLP